jgi:radical SAM protein with 4Fe4S-binding SPASM domain
MGVDVVQAQRALSFDDVTIQTRLQNNDFLKRIKEWEAIVNKASGVARNAHISFSWVGGSRSLSSSDGIDWFNHEPQRCVKPYYSCYITADGYVTACCVNPDPERHNFGNILETRFADIWKGQAYKTMRKAFSKGNIPEYCFTCTVPVT